MTKLYRMKFKVLPISRETVDRLKRTMNDGHGHTLTYTSPGRRMNPCRFCLADTDPGQRHLLAAYSPFPANRNPYAEVGPIYVHEHCEAYSDLHVFPPDIKKRKYLQVRGYNDQDELIAADITEGAVVEDLIETIFGNSEVAYVHVRQGQTGCYLLRVERA